jgi:hypothetical protein
MLIELPMDSIRNAYVNADRVDTVVSHGNGDVEIYCGGSDTPVVVEGPLLDVAKKINAALKK